MKIFSQIFSHFFSLQKTINTEMFDTVKYEKQKAMARFNMFQRMKKLVQIFELLVLLVLISWSTNKIPSAAKLSGNIFSQLKFYLKSPLVVFFIVNLIMLALFILRKQNDVVTDSGFEDIYEEYEQHSDNIQKPVTPPPPESPKLPEVREDDEKEMQIVVHDDHCDALSIAIADAAKKIRRFERTQSEKLKREIGVRPRKELRRSETENNRLVVRDQKPVDHLSNEEFKLAVDDFINKHRVFFKQQKMAEFKFN